MNAGMVFCDRHHAGIKYPKGGVGRMAQALAGERQTAAHMCVAFMACSMCADTMQAVCLSPARNVAVYGALSLQVHAKAAVCTSRTWRQGTSFLKFHICNCATAWLICACCQH